MYSRNTCRRWTDFETEGLPLDSVAAQRLWRVSRILNNQNPFGEEILSLTNPQIDFIFEMYAKDNPDKFKFEKTDNKKAEKLKIGTMWDNVLEGAEYEKFRREGYVNYIINASRKIRHDIKKTAKKINKNKK